MRNYHTRLFSLRIRDSYYDTVSRLDKVQAVIAKVACMQVGVFEKVYLHIRGFYLAELWIFLVFQYNSASCDLMLSLVFVLHRNMSI